MASIDKRPDGKYRARWRERPGGPQKTRSFDRKADASRFLATVEADLARGTYIDPGAGTVTLAEYAGGWQAVQVHRPLTELNVDVILRLHVLPGLGHLRLVDIRPSHLLAWKKDRGSVLASSSLLVAWRILGQVLRSAVADRLIAVSPAAGLKGPTVPKTKAVPLTVTEVAAVAEAAGDRYRALVVAAAGTGLREGELLGLTVDNVDFLRREIHVRQQLVLVPGHEPVLALPKTEASVRTVPLPAVVADALSAHLARYGPGPDNLIFTNDHGQPVRRNRLSDLWRSWARSARLSEQARFHDLRHSYASLLIAEGASVVLVQELLGHASAATTLDIYSHLFPDAADQARTAIERRLVLGHPAQRIEDQLRTGGPLPQG
jgi:integrase